MSARFWFPIWRQERSGTAHGLFLTNTGLALVIVFKIIQIASQLIESGECEFPFNLVSAMLMLAVSAFQFAHTRGYFNYSKERNDGTDY
jgi:hypothetical protein